MSKFQHLMEIMGFIGNTQRLHQCFLLSNRYQRVTINGQQTSD